MEFFWAIVRQYFDYKAVRIRRKESMSRNTDLAKNASILIFGKVCTQFVQFLLLPLYTALLVPEEFGVVDLFNTYITLLVPLFNWQFENGLFRFMLDCRNDKKEQRVITSTVLIANCFQSGLYVLFYIIFQGYIHSPYKVFLLIDVVLNIFLFTLLQFPRGLGRNAAYAAGSFINITSTVVLNVLFIAVLRMGAWGMFIGTAISKGISILYLIISQKVWEFFSVKLYSKQCFKKILRYSVPLIPDSISWWIINGSSRTVISIFLGVAANGIFSIASKFSMVYITVYNTFHLAWVESVSIHMNDADRNLYFANTINTVITLCASACMGIIACMPFVFPIIIQEQYWEAYYQIPILLIAVFFQVVQGLYSAIYVALKKTVEMTRTTFCSAIINIVVNVMLIRYIGLYAPSVASLAAFGAMALYRYFDVKKYIDAPLRSKSLLELITVGGVIVYAYYCRNMVWNVIALGIAVLYALIGNRKIIQTVISLVRAKMKNQNLG